MSTQGSHWLLIGNPIRARGKFAEAIQDPTGDWHHIPISCWDHPNVKLGRDVYRKAVTSRVAGQEAPPVGRKLQPLPYPGTRACLPTDDPDVLFPSDIVNPHLGGDRRVRRFRVVHGRLFDTPPMRACAMILEGGLLNCQRLLGEIFCSRVKYWSLRLHWLKLRGRVLVGGGARCKGRVVLGGGTARTGGVALWWERGALPTQPQRERLLGGTTQLVDRGDHRRTTSIGARRCQSEGDSGPSDVRRGGWG